MLPRAVLVLPEATAPGTLPPDVAQGLPRSMVPQAKQRQERTVPTPSMMILIWKTRMKTYTVQAMVGTHNTFIKEAIILSSRQTAMVEVAVVNLVGQTTSKSLQQRTDHAEIIAEAKKESLWEAI